MIHWRKLLLGFGVFLALGAAQTTQGLISGHVYDRLTGMRIAGAKIRFLQLETAGETRAESNSEGWYAQPRLSPGTYSIAVEKEGYQSAETTELRLFVAGRIDLDFPLRPASDVYSEKGYFNGWAAAVGAMRPIVHFYTADIETTKPEILPVLSGEAGGHQSAVSYVIDARILDRMPLIGRDAYTALASLAGVTSDTTTSRSLGLSVNGQRPSASNFLLDGLENNSYLLTGPSVIVAPEAIGEYRISTNNFSAEYGAASGFIANVTSRRGTEAWHGMAYSYWKNEALNANDFQRNASGRARTPLKELQGGLSLGGAVAQNLFTSLSVEGLRFRSRQDEAPYILPNARFVANPGSVAERLLRGFTRPAAGPDGEEFTSVAIAPPSTLNRVLALPRVDQVLGNGNHRLMYRVALGRISRPDLVWTPYPGYTMPMRENLLSAAIAWVGTLAPNLTAEVRAGVNLDDLQFDRPHAEVPLLQSFDNVNLPGSPAFYGFRNRSLSGQLQGNVAWLRGRHLVKTGGGLLDRTYSGFLTAGRDGVVQFLSLDDFGADNPINILLSIPRSGSQQAPVDFHRKYRDRAFSGFVQDDVRLLPRLTLNLGLRYESGGAPTNIGATPDTVIGLGSGATLGDRLRGAGWEMPAAGGQTLYRADRNNFAPRAGLAWSLGSNARTLIRAAYGLFYDRPFDNLWINLRKNNYVLATQRWLTNDPLPYGGGLRAVLGQLKFPATQFDQFRPILVDPELRTPYVHSFFAGVRTVPREGLSFEVNTLGSLGRRLITTDVVNRPPRPQPSLVDLTYRGNQGTSDYVALAATGEYRRSGNILRWNYTLSRMTDVQSEPLAGDFFDLRFSQSGAATGGGLFSTFTQESNTQAERGPSDFDQRHNFTVLAIWQPPAIWGRPIYGRLTKDWTIATMGALRSGFPFSVIAPTAAGPGQAEILQNRADLILPNAIAGSGANVCLPAVRGVRDNPVCGVQLLNKAAFGTNQQGMIGNTGRNQFRGPGLFSLDLSLSRSFAAPFLGEVGRLLLRLDAYNALNHVNLNRPSTSRLNRDDFGMAPYGREGRPTGFPALAPFQETPRQLQVLLRLEF